MATVLPILAVAALVAVVLSFIPNFEILHKVATILLSIAVILLVLAG